jgi:MFS family permease
VLKYRSLVQPTFISYFNNPSSSATGGIVAAFSAGATFGAFGCAYIGDPFGRLWALRIGAVIAAVGCALQAGSVNVRKLLSLYPLSDLIEQYTN